MSIYLKNGYVDIKKILGYGVPFNFLVGGRATGKTFGSLLYVLENNKRFMLMRRTQAQCDLINKPEFNPFKAVASFTGREIGVKPISKYNSLLLEYTGDDTYKTLGYTCALSTIANMRGFDASDVELLIYDEFIPEKHERKINFEGQAFLNAIETLGRNRELDGRKPLQVLCLANAFNMANALFLEMGLVGVCEKMIEKGQELYINRDRGVLIGLLNESAISEQKKDTALYKVSSGAFVDMSLGNDFVYNDTSDIKSMSLKEYKLACTVGEISIYKHKSEPYYYISEHRAGAGDSYTSDEVNIMRYRKKYGMRLYTAYMRGRVRFESMLTKSLFELYTI